MTELEGILRRRVDEGGPLTFRDFMELALYHPEHGYYSSGAVRTGRAGHFMTSAELDPSFGELWARAIEQTWELCGRPDRVSVVEIGGGEGGFAAAVLTAAQVPLTYFLVERVGEIERRQRERLYSFDNVSWIQSLNELVPGSAHFVIAVEVLDNSPVHVIERAAGSLREIYVGSGLRETPGALSDPNLERFGGHLREGERCEVALDAIHMAEQLARLVERGLVCFIDYGYEGPARNTLVAYSSAGADNDVLTAPGERDLTAHVAWDPVADALREEGLEVHGPRLQAEVLRSLGVAELDRSLRARHDAALSEGRGAEALRALSRRQALRALLDEGGLGGLQVLVGGRGIERPDWMKSSR
ncbi:MAG TPA: SAM-dependent methyltransferase [Actinomycetota bacterium]|nr:SAM-dependent methyltransferase [Actinomycetota bacterium]